MSKKHKSTARIMGEIHSTQSPVRQGPVRSGKGKKENALAGPGSSRPLDPVTRVRVICEWFCEGNRVEAIRNLLKEKYGDRGKLSREMVYSHVHAAGLMKMLVVEAIEHAEYRDKLFLRCRRRVPVHVVRTSSSHHVARRAARVLLDLVRKKAAQKGAEEPVHIGIAAGYSMRHLAQAFADLLCGPADGLPQEIVFHTLVPGFDDSAPWTDPNSFSAFFDQRDVMRVNVRFHGLQAPAIVRATGLSEVMSTEMIRQAKEALRQLDIVIMSGAEWKDKHSLYRRGLDRASAKTVGELRKAGCIGDIMGGAVGPQGPLNLETDARTLMLLGLDDLRGQIRNGTRVLLMLGPCHACGEPKENLLAATVDQEDLFITHLVVDSRSARRYLGEKVRHGGRRSGNGTADFDRHEKMTAVAQLLTEGWTFGEMEKLMKERFVSLAGVDRPELYSLVNAATKEKLIHFRPPYHLDYGQKVSDLSPALENVTVVRTVDSQEVAQQGAKMLFGLVQARTIELELEESEGKREKGQKVVRIGFAAGIAMRQLAAAFADLLRQPQVHLPDKIACHSLVTGFDMTDPATDPNAFFTYLCGDLGLQVEIEPVWLPAPLLVKDAEAEILHDEVAIRRAREALKEVDLLVTSGADWRDKHSLYRRSLEKEPGDSVPRLLARGCMADIFCQCLSREGPIEEMTGLQAFSLVKLRELPDMIARGKKVLLVAGPCGGCGKPKGDLLDAVLSQEKPLITHLVVDTRTAAEYVSSRAQSMN